jgi:molybdopterin synthase catalytic subunit
VRITVLCFAAARDATGEATLSLELETGARVADAGAILVARHPRLALAVPVLRFAVAEEFVTPEHVLRDGDTLALLPPVSGG